MPGPGTGPQAGGWETLVYRKNGQAANRVRKSIAGAFSQASDSAQDEWLCDWQRQTDARAGRLAPAATVFTANCYLFCKRAVRKCSAATAIPSGTLRSNLKLVYTFM